MFSKEPNFPWKQDSSHPLTPLNYLVVVTPHSSEINRTTKAKIRARAPNLRLVGLSLYPYHDKHGFFKLNPFGLQTPIFWAGNQHIFEFPRLWWLSENHVFTGNLRERIVRQRTVNEIFFVSIRDSNSGRLFGEPVPYLGTVCDLG